MSLTPFTGNFTQQESISDSAIMAATEVLRSGRLHRYNTAEGEVSQTAQLETEYAAWQGSKILPRLYFWRLCPEHCP